MRARSWLFAPGGSEKKMEKAAASTPRAEELAEAQEIVDLFAANPGVGAIGYKGAMLDRPHLARARALLASGGRG